MSQSDNKQEVIYNLIISLNYKKKKSEKNLHVICSLYFPLYRNWKNNFLFSTTQTFILNTETR